MRIVMTFGLWLFCISSLLAQFDLDLKTQDSIRIEKLYSTITSNRLNNRNNDSIKVTIGNIFSIQIEHAIISIESEGIFTVRLYTTKHKRIEKRLLSFSFYSINQPKDTIFDVSGDKVKDFVITWYPSSGCCPADAYEIFAYNSVKEIFNRKIHILNPTFMPAKRQVIIMGYGHPGQVTMYRLKWEGSKLDTLQELKWDNKNRSSILIDFKTKQKQTLKRPPTEFAKAAGFDWFSDNLVQK